MNAAMTRVIDLIAAILLHFAQPARKHKAPVLDKINILTTGGTIDKIYYDDKSDYKIGEPEIGRILTAMNLAFRWEVRALLRKDSLHMTDDDRHLIRQAVLTSNDPHYLITHGTDTMTETAAVLQDLDDRVIVMTGALHPARFVDSDAVFNIGCAIGALQSLPPGVWIVMNGRVWDPAHVRKNRSANRFEAC